MKTLITINIDQEMKRELEEVDNISGLINSLLRDYFERQHLNIGTSVEKEILEQTKKKMEQEKIDEINANMEKVYYDYMNEHRFQYNKGYKEGLWKSLKEFYDKNHENKEEINKDESP